jgi:hypothetical protein
MTTTSTQLSQYAAYTAELQISSANQALALTEDSVQLSGKAKDAVANAHQATTVQSLEQIVRDAAAGDMSALSRLAIIR